MSFRDEIIGVAVLANPKINDPNLPLPILFHEAKAFIVGMEVRQPE
jgi:hypothetical protein